MRVDTMSASRRGDSWSRPFFKFGKKGRDQGAEYSAKSSSNPDGRTETLRLKDDVEESKCRPYTDNSYEYIMWLAMNIFIHETGRRDP